MKKIIISIVFTLAFIFGSYQFVQAQAVNRISQRCAAPNRNVYSLIEAVALGDLTYLPCPSRSSLFYGIVDFTNATIVGSGFISGSGTINTIPKFTAASTVGNSRITDAGAAGDIVVNGGAHAVNIGDTSNVGNQSKLLLDDAIGKVYYTSSGCVGMSLDRQTNTGRYELGDISGCIQGNYIRVTASTKRLDMEVGTGGAAYIGDPAQVGSKVLLTVNDAAGGSITGNSGTYTLSDVLNTANFKFAFTPVTGTTGGIINLGNPLDATATDRVGIFAHQGAKFINIFGDVGVSLIGRTASIGDGNAAGNSTIFTVTDASKTFAFTNTGNTGIIDWGGILTFNLQRTITAGGTTGAQTINKPNGSVNFAAAATSLVVTNSSALTTSLINAIAQTHDATCHVQDVVAAAGSFTINMTAACTAETKVAFWVYN